MSIKLSDTQLVMLSAAAQRDDRSLTPPEKLKGGAAHKVAAKLIVAGLVKEVKAKAGTPVWRRDEQARQSYALKLTAAGARAIAVDPEDGAEPVGDKQRPNRTRSIATRRAARSKRCWSVGCTEPANACEPSRAASRDEAGAGGRDGSTEGATIAELSEATRWLPHTTRAVVTGLRKRGYMLTLDRSDKRRGLAYRVAESNSAHAGTVPIVIGAAFGCTG
jgi:hypothetical protein